MTAQHTANSFAPHNQPINHIAIVASADRVSHLLLGVRAVCRWKYDDDVVSEVKSDDIKALSGGGDWHMAYLLVYKLDKDFQGKHFIEEQTAAKDEEMKVDGAQQSSGAAPATTSS